MVGTGPSPLSSEWMNEYTQPQLVYFSQDYLTNVSCLLDWLKDFVQYSPPEGRSTLPTASTK